MKLPLVKEFSAKCLLHVADQIRSLIQAKRGELAPLSLGLPALQGMYKGKREHRRWYDEDPIMQKAFAAMYSLPTAGLTVLSFKISDTMGLIGIYDYVCQQIGQEPSVRDLFNITKSGLEEGKDEAEQILKDIVGIELYDAFSREYQGQHKF